MKVYLTNQAKYFINHLKYFKSKAVIKYNKLCLNEKISLIEINSSKSFNQLDTTFFWDYKIFPNNIMGFITEWTCENRSMQIGDTIVQQAYIPPIRGFSQKIIFGVRINNIIKEKNRIGFSYETLIGHVEMGESTFTIEKTFEGKTIFKIHTFSKPGNWLTRLVGPFFQFLIKHIVPTRRLKT